MRDWFTSRRDSRNSGGDPTTTQGAMRPHEENTAMRIGVPKETKTLEGRVALVPAAAGDLHQSRT